MYCRLAEVRKGKEMPEGTVLVPSGFIPPLFAHP